MAEYFLKCQDCGYEFAETYYAVDCPKCNGLIGVELESPVSERKLDNSQKSIFRYHQFMPYNCDEYLLGLENIETIPEIMDEKLSEILDVELIHKDETLMPTGTWKDREGFVSIHRLFINNISDLMVFSSGNTGTSLARSACIAKGPKLHMVVPSASRIRVLSALENFMDPNYVDLEFFDGSNDECIVKAAEVAKEMGYTIEGGFSNYARREGLKLVGLEHIWENDKKAEWYVQPIAGGIGVYSFDKAFHDSGLDSPRILGVQAEICSPMVNAWDDNDDVLKDRHIPEYIPSEFVRVLRTRNPGDAYRILKLIMDKVRGCFKKVSDEEILAGIRLFYHSEYYINRYHNDGMIIGLEPATALAGIVKAVKDGTIEKGSRVLLNVSGAAKKGDVKLEWFEDLV